MITPTPNTLLMLVDAGSNLGLASAHALFCRIHPA